MFTVVSLASPTKQFFEPVASKNELLDRRLDSDSPSLFPTRMVLTSTSFPGPVADARSRPPELETASLPTIVQLRTVQSPSRSFTHRPPPDPPPVVMALPATRHVSIVTAPFVSLTAMPAPKPPWRPLADALLATMEWSIEPCPPAKETP